MAHLRKPYQMYVLNLDTSRIFWLTALLILLLCVSFFSGFLTGRVSFRSEESELVSRNKTVLDQVISKIGENGNAGDEEYQFYELMTPGSRKESRPAAAADEKKETEAVTARREEIERTPVLPEKTAKKSAPDQGEYLIQVASYRGAHYARSLESSLKAAGFPSFVSRQNIRGVLYYRVRIGPFSSRALALKVLSSVRNQKECSVSYITRDE